MASTFRVINRGQIMTPFPFGPDEDTLAIEPSGLREMRVDLFADSTVEVREIANGPAFVIPVNMPYSMPIPPGGIILRLTGANGSPGLLYGRVQ